MIVDRQKIIFAGKVLRDEQKVSELGLSESDFLVCMITKEAVKVSGTSIAVCFPNLMCPFVP